MADYKILYEVVLDDGWGCKVVLSSHSTIDAANHYALSNKHLEKIGERLLVEKIKRVRFTTRDRKRFIRAMRKIEAKRKNSLSNELQTL